MNKWKFDEEFDDNGRRWFVIGPMDDNGFVDEVCRIAVPKFGPDKAQTESAELIVDPVNQMIGADK